MDGREIKLSVNNLKISFRTDGGKVQAVRGINFDLYKGETLALVGESGSGKSVTNRAIMGILAGNAIKEAGEIIYDGRDLMKISEEEFHRLRGDKIAMIFQDPMSSLNPIMRVGKQMTEATLIKGKVARKESRAAFNEKLKMLYQCMDQIRGEGAKAEDKKKCQDFNKFVYKNLDLEYAYNKAHEAMDDVLDELGDFLFRIEKHAYKNLRRDIGEIVKLAYHTRERYVVHRRADELTGLLTELKPLIKIPLLQRGGNFFRALFNRDERQDTEYDAEWTVISEKLMQVKKILEEAAGYTKPDFFAMGYYAAFANEPLPELEIQELNEFLRKYLDEHFLQDFFAIAKEGIRYSNEKSIAEMQSAISVIDSKIDFFRKSDIGKKEALETAKTLTDAVERSINRLDTVKNNILYTFATSLNTAIDVYFQGIIRNAAEVKRYAKQTARYEKQAAKGKKPEYTVAEKDLVDLDTLRQDIVNIISRTRNELERSIKVMSGTDYDTKVVELIDYFKEKASAVAFKVTRRMAKNRAIKLLEEVGISEPRKRYRQYPFEFSGGMRQRIVIAIALSANPDVLICDEPTTALDVTIQSQILELINKVKEERQLSVIFITHDLGVVANMADRVAVMYAGKIVEMGTAKDVFYAPAHPYTWALLSSMPDLDTKETLEAIPGTPPNMIYPPKGDAFAKRNKYALKIDFEQEPPMFQISDSHQAATWLLHPNAPKVDPPKIVLDRIERMKEKAGGKGC